MDNVETEIRLFRSLAEGSRESFKELFIRYHPRVKSLCFGILKSEPDAEDMSQEIFIKLWNERTKLAAVQQPGGYLFTLSRNALYNHLESQQVRKNHLQHFQVPEIDHRSPHEELVAADLRLLVDMWVEQMPPQRRQIYRMSRDQGISNAEIAEELGITKKTVENQLNSALKTLRSVISLLGMLLFLNQMGT